MEFIERVARRSIDSKVVETLEIIRTGWSDYSFIFYIGGVAAILGGIFGTVGWLSVIFTLIFFYFLGRFRVHQKNEMERRARSHGFKI